MNTNSSGGSVRTKWPTARVGQVVFSSQSHRGVGPETEQRNPPAHQHHPESPAHRPSSEQRNRRGGKGDTSTQEGPEGQALNNGQCLQNSG